MAVGCLVRSGAHSLEVLAVTRTLIAILVVLVLSAAYGEMNQQDTQATTEYENGLLFE